ncbi:hypothetical protein K435DRAFT_843915 [Dendrothele bispora CBS 962.96]|uniref:Uncharacterized protein n=1 Tax=Dendrothele bispora (strain CBS 962.96) TaxID=1314807 RepID=A0A4V4HCM3_DENBC|nr:hypothetical protein K435DRAFT_843915 [Dendrothele bispora CBS 962.96]
MSLPLVSVNLATVAIESFLYGIFFVLGVTGVYLQIDSHRRRAYSPHRNGFKVDLLFKNPMFIGAISISATVTAHWICTVIRLFDAFVNFENGSKPLEFYADLSQLTEVVKTGFLMATLVIGDTMIIYRLWVIWGHNPYVVIFPLMTLVGLTVCGIGITYQFTQYFPGLDVFNSDAGRWITSDCVFTLCTNLYSTVMIALRLWKAEKSLADAAIVRSGMGMNDVLVIVVESAAVYTSWNILFFASYQSGSNLQFNAVDCWPEMAGIAFMLINVRAGFRKNQAGTRSLSSTAGNNTSNSVYRNRIAGVHYSTSEHPMLPLSVNISTVTDTNRDTGFGRDKNDLLNG